MTDKLYLKPKSAGYSVSPPSNAVVRIEMDGGASETSAEFDGGTSRANCTFVLDRGEWQYMEAFFRNRTGGLAEPFLIDLVLDGAPETEYTVKLVAETKVLSESLGKRRTVTMQLEVYPAEVDEDADSSIVDIYEASGGDMEGYINGFADIIAALPDA